MAPLGNRTNVRYTIQETSLRHFAVLHETLTTATNMHELQTLPDPGAASVIVAIPAYNKDRFIGSLVLKLRARDRHVVVVDDGSTDATAKVAEAAGATVLRHPHNRGKTAAVKTIFEQARRLNADALVLLDGDSQHDPSEVDALVGPI